MNANPVPASGAATANFELPALSSSTFLTAQQVAAPFSQLLQKAQSQPAPPATPPPPASPPPSPPAPPQRSSNPGTANTDGNQAGANSTTNGASATTNSTQASDDAASPNQSNASSPDTNAASTDNQATGRNAIRSQSAKQVDAAGHTAKGAGRGKPSGKSSGDDRHDLAVTTAETTSAELKVAAASAKALTSDKGGKQPKDDSHSSGGSNKKSEATADSGSVAAEVPATVATPTPTPAAALVAALPATATTVPAENSKGAGEASPASSGKQLVKDVRIASATVKAQPPTTPGPLKSKQQTVKTPVTPNASPDARRAQTAAQESNAVAPPLAAPVKSSTDAPLVTQPTTTAGESDSPSSEATTAVQTIATVAANQAQAVPTITIDPSTSGQAKPDVSVANAPPTPQPATAVGGPPTTTPPTGSSQFAAAPSHSASLDPTAGSGLSTLDRARFVQRVSRAFQAAGDQGGQIRLRLSPPELGSLQMQISVKQGAMTAQIQTDNSTAQQVLLDSLPELRDRLAQQDIRIDRFDVQVAGQSSGGLPQSPQGNPDLNQMGRRFSPERSAPTPAVTAENTEPTRVASTLNSLALNVVV